MSALPGSYPVQLGLAYLFLGGYLVRSLFLSLKMPGSVGVILSGFAFSYFIQEDIEMARDKLQQLAFFLVLLTAGFEISLWDLKPYILVMALLPAALEMLGIACYGVWMLNYTWVEGMVLGTTLFCVGDGLVIPKMNEFGIQFPGNPLPRLVFMWAPLEASAALTGFGILAGLSEPAHQDSVDVKLLVVANIVRIVATISVGALLGAASGWIIPRRMAVVSITGQRIFTGATVEALLMIISVALIAFAIGVDEGGEALIPMGFSSGSLFQSELLVIVTGAFFAAVADAELLHEVESTMGGIWVFGQLILFSMLGSRTQPGVFVIFFEVLPIMVAGLCMRFLGVFIAVVATLPIRPCTCEGCRRANWLAVWPDTAFCFLSMLPRATIQGALGSVPSAQRFFKRDDQRHHIHAFIANTAKLYIVCMGIFGSILLDLLGPHALRAAAAVRRESSCVCSEQCSEAEAEEEPAAVCWTGKERERRGSRVLSPEDLPDPNSFSRQTSYARQTSGSPVPAETRADAANGDGPPKLGVRFQTDVSGDGDGTGRSRFLSDMEPAGNGPLRQRVRFQTDFSVDGVEPARVSYASKPRAFSNMYQFESLGDASQVKPVPRSRAQSTVDGRMPVRARGHSNVNDYMPTVYRERGATGSEDFYRGRGSSNMDDYMLTVFKPMPEDQNWL